MIIDLIQESQHGNQDATMKLIKTFSPTLRKYARALEIEDAYQDLQLDFIEVIQNVLRKKMHSKNTAHLCGVFVFAKENREKYSEKVTRRESDSHFSKNRTFGDAERQKVTRTPPLSAQRPPAARQIIWRTAGGLFVCRTSCPLCRACFLFPLVPLYFPDIRDGPDGTSVL